jgi:hypothetical protein
MNRCLGYMVLFLAASCSPAPPPPAGPAATPPPPGTERRLEADVRFLASDLLEGRGTPSRGLDVAAEYLAEGLRGAGVAPAAGGSYQQWYSVAEYRPAEARVVAAIDGKPLKSEDYLFLNFVRDPAAGPIDLELVYTGTGVVAEERKTDELSGLDLKKKAAVALKGAPWTPDPAETFGPERAIGKVMAATVRGAEMLVYLSQELDTGAEAEAAFFREMKSAPVAFMRETGVGAPSALNPIFVLRPAAFETAIGSRLDGLKQGPLGKRIRITIEAPVSAGRASNVLGKIPGADPALTGEWIVLSAHYDHLGSHAAKPGEDGIWNGADDDASGTAGVLEIARRFAASPGKRSVLVFFTSGEDRGIFGSAYYAAHPSVPMSQVIAQVNLDMIGRSEGKVEGIAPAAPGLFAETVELGKAHGIEVIPDQHPAWRTIYLTDVYHFARFGVPGVEFFTGLHADYHQPGDTADKIRYRTMTRIVEVASALARSYADGKTRPAFTRPAWFLTPP